MRCRHPLEIRNEIAVGALLAACASCPASAADIFFAEVMPGLVDGAVRKISTDGGVAQTIVPVGGGLVGLAIDSVNGKVYWTDVFVPAIRRANLDGSEQEDVITSGLQYPSAVAIDTVNAKVYWGDQTAGEIRRANFDGSNDELVIPTPFHRGLVIDAVNAKIYWNTDITQNKGEILRSNLDGSNPEVAISSDDPLFKPAAMVLDPAGANIYWTDYVFDVVRRSDVDGVHIDDLYIVPTNNNPRGIALDLKDGKVYWGQDLDFKQTVDNIQKMDLNGANPQIFAADLGMVHSMVLLSVAACPADIAPGDGDGSVAVDDLLLVINSWGACQFGKCAADIAPKGVGDGEVNIDDLLEVINAWGPCE